MIIVTILNWIIKYSKKYIKSFTEDFIFDGYHTFREYFNFRKHYNATLFNEWAKYDTPKYDVHKSKFHYDGKRCFGGGWFIVVAMLPTGQISNHYKIEDWDLFNIPEYDKAKYKWDGHTSSDVLDRLNEFNLLNSYVEYGNKKKNCKSS